MVRPAPSSTSYFVPGAPHVIRTEPRQTLFSYQDYHTLLLALAGHTDLRIIGNTITGFQNGVDGIAIAGARNVIIKDNVLRASKPNEGSHVLPVRGGSSSLFRSELRLTLAFSVFRTRIVARYSDLVKTGLFVSYQDYRMLFLIR